MKKSILFAIVTLVSFCLTASRLDSQLICHVFGTVTDAETNEVLVGATVKVKGNSYIFAITDLDGFYSLRTATNLKGETLVFSYVGYETESIVAKSSNQKLDVKLKPEGYRETEE